VVYQGGLKATSILTQSSGTPVPKATISFSVMTDFGMMPLGTGTTATNGSAFLVSSLLSPGWTELVSSYKGTGNFNSSSATLYLNGTSMQPAQNSASPYVSGQEGTVDLRLIGVPQLTAAAVVDVFLVVLGCVYFVFIVVVVQTLRIRRRSSVAK